MPDSNEFDNPNKIYRLDKLRIETVSGHASPHIYANGKNQLPVKVTVKIVDESAKPLKFSQSTWVSILNLRFAESDKKLNFKGNDGWCFTDVENEYSEEISVGLVAIRGRSMSPVTSPDGTAIIILYVYSHTTGTRRIAVSVDTDNGKHFTTADNASNAEKMSVRITANPKIDYSDRRNINIMHGDFVDLSNSLGWTSRLTTEGPYKGHYNGTCKRRIVRIAPNQSSTGQTKFKYHEIVYDPIFNKDVNDGSLSWEYGVNQPKQDCFTLMQVGYGYPCTVIGRGARRENYQLNIWYSRQNHVNINGEIFLRDASYYYRFCPYVNEQHLGTDEQGFASLLLYKFTMPENNTHQYKWHDVIRPVTVKLTDYFGNEGMIKLTFDDLDNFDIPGIV